MRSQTTAGTAIRPHHSPSRTPARKPQKLPQPQPCIWECVYVEPHPDAGKPRMTTNGSGICDTCVHRREEHAAKGAKWRRIRRAQIGSWNHGLEDMD